MARMISYKGDFKAPSVRPTKEASSSRLRNRASVDALFSPDYVISEKNSNHPRENGAISHNNYRNYRRLMKHLAPIQDQLPTCCTTAYSHQPLLLKPIAALYDFLVSQAHPPANHLISPPPQRCRSSSLSHVSQRRRDNHQKSPKS